MIKRKTLFVLGAGASMPYGMPSGPELVAEILKLRNTDMLQESSTGSLKTQFDSRCYQLKKFQDLVRSSDVASIDLFIKHNPGLASFGKFLIARILLGREEEKRLDGSYSKSEATPNGDHWYKFMWEKMVVDVEEAKELQQNQIAFITFNYDISLESYLARSIRGLFSQKLEHNEEYAILSHFPIIHVFGSLLGQHTDETPFRSYNGLSPILSYSHLNDLSQNLLTIGEAFSRVNSQKKCNLPNDHQMRIQNLFDQAERIIFLGLGYHPENLDVLNPSRWIHKADRGNYLYMSAYGLSKADLSATLSRLHGKEKSAVEWPLPYESTDEIVKYKSREFLWRSGALN
ncbi:MAG: hypothetical protein JST12_20285 [Armatimonadetes bacterium]|nr:hypothetical protein [Armatimonadota bacterium]